MKRGVSKDAPGGANEAASWTILRDAMMRIAPQDEAVELAPAVVGIALGVMVGCKWRRKRLKRLDSRPEMARRQASRLTRRLIGRGPFGNCGDASAHALGRR